ncbi:hypothetical protein K458DRAFT_385903 [Lentithecium fluviatile CBS 122367]|uniref:Uncharacterized protein n=1 Tax=Lentithecium fluviatile CBS 122367 TaxID=1168545 RepID=A0A6G1JA19_9PLEO|nr:hypothetical protein K458DRAFT_385903 [Lentithecium fluviatile CBS 122367]
MGKGRNEGERQNRGEADSLEKAWEGATGTGVQVFECLAGLISTRLEWSSPCALALDGDTLQGTFPRNGQGRRLLGCTTTAASSQAAPGDCWSSCAVTSSVQFDIAEQRRQLAEVKRKHRRQRALDAACRSVSPISYAQARPVQARREHPIYDSPATQLMAFAPLAAVGLEQREEFSWTTGGSGTQWDAVGRREMHRASEIAAVANLCSQRELCLASAREGKPPDDLQACREPI